MNWKDFNLKLQVLFIFLFFACIAAANIYIDYLQYKIFISNGLNDSLGKGIKYMGILLTLMFNGMSIWFIRASYRFITGKSEKFGS